MYEISLIFLNDESRQMYLQWNSTNLRNTTLSAYYVQRCVLSMVESQVCEVRPRP